MIKRFVKKDVEDKLNEFLRSELENEEYDANHSVVRSKELSSKILELLKKCGYPRYKFIVQVVITSTSGQGIRVASRFLWDPSTDNYASASFKNVSSLNMSTLIFKIAFAELVNLCCHGVWFVLRINYNYYLIEFTLLI